MSLFDQLVNEALRSRAELTSLRPVVEKELLHHDILREMGEAGLLTGLTFIGGTCLRACYGSARLSEDLDFTGGIHFKKGDLAELARVLVERLQTRYALPVSVSEPVKTGGKVSTWKLTIETRPGQKNLPAQRIHLDICAIPSHDPRPMMLRNLYGIDLGTWTHSSSAEPRGNPVRQSHRDRLPREPHQKPRPLGHLLAQPARHRPPDPAHPVKNPRSPAR